VKTLVIDTATKACSVALYDGETLLACAHEIIGRGHAERLLPLISGLPECGKPDRIFVDVGPGSFTGIRVGVAAAKALGFAWQVPVHGFSCLQLVAAMARHKTGKNDAVNVVMTGGHGEYFHQRFGSNGLPANEIRSLTPVQVEKEIGVGYAAGDASHWYLIADIAPLTPSPTYGRAPDAKLPQARIA
jgi:tRNA threonylcarbamoyladenosine biosynthesis protein TsaB